MSPSDSKMDREPSATADHKKDSKSVKFTSSVDESSSKNTQASKTEQQQDQDHRQEQQQRSFDVIIFAASGSVGRYLVEELALVVDKYYSSEPAASSGGSLNDGDPQQFAQQVLRRRSVPSSSKSGNSIKWAVAGRSAVRLSESLCRAELSTGIRNLSSSVPVILADLNHQRSLLAMCAKTRLVINCAGPYSELGAELLIAACIESGTHYVDLAHETTFIESIAKLYSERATRKGVLILNGCGFQSMSAECGINFMKQVADGRIEQVKIILSLSDTSALVRLGPSSSTQARKPQSVGIVSRGMWNSLLAEKSQEISIEERILCRQQLAAKDASHTSEDDDDEFTNNNVQLTTTFNEAQQEENIQETSRQSKQTTGTWHLAKPLLQRKNTQMLVKDIVQFRNRAVSLAWPLQLIQGFQIQKGRGYCWPIDALTSDESQLIRSEMNTYELRQPDLDSADGWRPVRTSSYVSVKNFTHLCILFIWFFIFQILIKFSPARYLMRKLPQLASLGHVTSNSPKQALDRDGLSHIKYCQTFIAYGQPSDSSGDPLEERDRHTQRRQVQLLVSRVVGPEPNHVATATFAIQAALTVLMERDHLPATGGVLTPGAAFSETNIIYQLRRRNIKFEVLKKA